jgi:hypothetical protein
MRYKLLKELTITSESHASKIDSEMEKLCLHPWKKSICPIFSCSPGLVERVGCLESSGECG